MIFQSESTYNIYAAFSFQSQTVVNVTAFIALAGQTVWTFLSIANWDKE